MRIYINPICYLMNGCKIEKILKRQDMLKILLNLTWSKKCKIKNSI